MFLRDLAVELSGHAVLPEGYTAREFHDSTHAVVERFLDRIPRRKVRLAEAAKIILYVGPRPEAGRGNGFFVLPDGVAFLWLRDVGLDLDLSLYAQSDRGTQQQMLLSMLHAGLMAIVQWTAADPAPFQAAADDLRQQPFPLPEIPERELLQRWGLFKGQRRPGRKRT